MSFCLAAVWGFAAHVAFAQSALERLEQQIRQRNPRAGANDATPPAQPTPAVSADATRSNDSPYLGLVGDDQNDRGRGVRVLTVSPGGPADKAGIRRQDLVTAMTGVRIRQMSDLADLLSTFSAGQTTTVEILRDGKKQTAKLTFGRRSTETKLPPAGTQPSKPVPTPPLPNMPPAMGDSAESDPTKAMPAELSDQPESIPAPPGELLPEPPEQPNGPALQPAQQPAEMPPPVAEVTLQPAKPAVPTSKAEKPASKVEKPLPRVLSTPSSDAQRIAELERRVEALERRVAELERSVAEASKSR